MTTHFTNAFTVMNLIMDCTVINARVCSIYGSGTFYVEINVTTHFTNVFTVINLIMDCTVINARVCSIYRIGRFNE